MISDLGCCYYNCLGAQEPSLCKTENLINKCCVYSDCLSNQLFSHLYPYRVPLPHCLRCNNVENRLVNTSTIFFKCSSKRKACISYFKLKIRDN